MPKEPQYTQISAHITDLQKEYIEFRCKKNDRSFTAELRTIISEKIKEDGYGKISNTY